MVSLRLAILLTLALSPSGNAFSETASLSAAADPVLAPLRQRVQQWVTSEHLPNLQLAFARDDTLIWSEVFHGSSAATATTLTRFRIASVSKCITGTALLRMHQDGDIDLDRPITRYFPCDVPDADHMTARLLAGHLAGLRHYHPGELANAVHYDRLAAGLAIFDKSPLLSPPGAAFHYSSYGFNLLGCVMEAAAHEPFPLLVREQVLQPLHMSHTEVDDLTRPLPDVAPTYIRLKEGSIFPVKPSDDSYKWPSGGYLSTAEDLTLLGEAYFAPGFLSRASLALAETSQKTSSGQVTNYSIGWALRRDPQGDVVLFHTGEALGGESFLAVCPARRQVFAAVWDVSYTGLSDSIDQISRGLFQAKQ